MKLQRKQKNSVLERVRKLINKPDIRKVEDRILLTLITIDPTMPTWKSLPEKIQAIEEELGWNVRVVYKDLTPVVKNGYITHKWMDTLKEEFPGYVMLHMSMKQGAKLKIKLGLRGAQQIDTDGRLEAYVISDEKTKREGYNRFIETTLHEIRHELCMQKKVKDDTHELHKKNGTIRGTFTQLLN